MSILKQLIFTPKCVICQRLGVEFCVPCIARIRPFRARDLNGVEVCVCAGDYSDWLRDSLICYKNGDLRQAQLLAFLLEKTLNLLSLNEPFTLIPIPSSPQKITERGFDSITNLCLHFVSGGQLVRVDASILFLRRAVVDQVGLSAVQRHENLEGAFSARRSINGTVVIVDDVITTGATISSAAQVLKLAGAQRVFAVALCGSPKTR